MDMMENEIQVGEYVRNSQGIICKITGIEIGETYKGDIVLYEFDNKILVKEKDFYNEKLKHSKNIIDLIEVGDVLEFKEDNLIAIMAFTDDWKEEFENLIEKINNREIDLLSILTKEQYSQNCYKVVK